MADEYEVHLVEDGWNCFKEILVPDQTSPARLALLKQAYFGGVMCILHLQAEIIKADTTTEQAVDIMDMVCAEVEAYNQRTRTDAAAARASARAADPGHA